MIVAAVQLVTLLESTAPICDRMRYRQHVMKFTLRDSKVLPLKLRAMGRRFNDIKVKLIRRMIDCNLRRKVPLKNDDDANRQKGI